MDEKITDSNIEQTKLDSEETQKLDTSDNETNTSNTNNALNSSNWANFEDFKTSQQVVDFSEEAEVKERKHSKHKKKFSVLKTILICLTAVIVLLISFCVWNRWFRYSDTTDIVSNWQVNGTNTTVKIDKKQIYLDKNTIFNYEVDEGAKLLYLKTGDYSGTCKYRFSGDRCQLALIDSGDMNAVASAWSDICWFFDYIKWKIGGVDLSPAYIKESDKDGGASDASVEQTITEVKGQSILLDKVSTQKVSESK